MDPPAASSAAGFVDAVKILTSPPSPARFTHNELDFPSYESAYQAVCVFALYLDRKFDVGSPSAKAK